ncbi:MAG: J domain-containing protein [Microcoleaceae cyanobacterium MO_207.B10]|nr:J domain-containing protein [Microcoleaceae cyanobacterium MO_207.B10]
MSKYTPLGVSYYSLLGLHPAASPREIRIAYRKLSKRYHPDTTDMPKAIATIKFQQINEAYATLVNPEKRLAYNKKIRHLYLHDLNQDVNFKNSVSDSSWKNSSSYYLDPTERPLSGGELFALFIMGITLIACLVIAITIGLMRPELSIQPIEPPGTQFIELVSPFE